MTPEQAKFLLEFTLPTLKQETATTAKVIAATPNAHLDYRPSERCMPASELVWHIASADVMFLEGILSGAFGPGPAKPEEITTPEQISAWYTEKMSAAIEKLSAYTPRKPPAFSISMDSYSPRGRHHHLRAGSQHSPSRAVVVLPAPHGGKVPSIYGPSADENPFAKTEAQSA